MTTRRSFLATAAAAGATAAALNIIPSHVLGREGAFAPSDKITLGVVGIGPRCTYDLKAMLQLADVKCVAIADVQASRREAGKKLVDEYYKNNDCVLFRDFRDLLARKDIDAVIIATGDRWHAPASILAAEAGKDVYSEKPCGITIELCQQLADTFKRTGRVFQAGTQRRSVPNFVKAVEIAHSGKLGKLQTLFASVYVPTLDNTWLPGEQTPAKEICDWNLWLGPAAWRPYNQKYVNGGWRGQYDFDSGARLLDWGAHTVDLCQWANQADNTMPVEYDPTPKGIICKYENGVKLVLDFVVNPFGNREPGWKQSLGTCPVRYVGAEGSIETGDSGEIECSIPAIKSELASYPKQNGLDVGTHARNFFDCVRSRSFNTAANPTVMRRSHIACHAASIAWMLNRKLKFDPAKEAFIGDEEANGLRARAAREWKA